MNMNVQIKKIYVMFEQILTRSCDSKSAHKSPRENRKQNLYIYIHITT